MGLQAQCRDETDFPLVSVESKKEESRIKIFLGLGKTATEELFKRYSDIGAKFKMREALGHWLRYCICSTGGYVVLTAAIHWLFDILGLS